VPAVVDGWEGLGLDGDDACAGAYGLVCDGGAAGACAGSDWGDDGV